VILVDVCLPRGMVFFDALDVIDISFVRGAMLAVRFLSMVAF